MFSDIESSKHTRYDGVCVYFLCWGVVIIEKLFTLPNGNGFGNDGNGYFSKMPKT